MTTPPQKAQHKMPRPPPGPPDWREEPQQNPTPEDVARGKRLRHQFQQAWQAEGDEQTEEEDHSPPSSHAQKQTN